MNAEWYRQLADDVANGHITEERADQLEREYDLAEHLDHCRRECEDIERAELAAAQ